MFWGSKAVQDSLGRPKKAPKRHLKSSKTLKKQNLKINRIFTNCWTAFGAICWSKSAQKGDQKGDRFWNPLPPANRTPNVAKTENKREGRKVTGCWIYIQKKKGRDEAFKVLIKALKGRIKREGIESPFSKHVEDFFKAF